MNIIENTAMVVSTNLGETRELQGANGVTHVDPDDWQPKRYELGEDVLLGGNVYRYVVNNNAIPKVGGGFETLTEMAERIAYKRNCPFGASGVSGAGSGGSSLAIDAQIKDLSITCPSGIVIPTATGKVSFDLELGAFANFTWNGAFKLAGNYGKAEQVQGENGLTQIWRVKDFDLPINPATEDYSLVIFNASTGTQAGSQSFWFYVRNGSVDFRDTTDATLADLYEYQNPIKSPFWNVDGEDSIGNIDYVIQFRNFASFPLTGKGFLSGIMTIRSEENFTWDGNLRRDTNTSTPESFIAIRMPDDGADNAKVQRWIVDNAVFDFAFRNRGILAIRRQSNEPLIYGSFEGKVSESIIIPTERGFIGDINFWVLIRSNARDSFFDTKPAVGIGRYGAVQVQVSSETPFDSVALVNCECLEAEVEGLFRQSCQVHGVDTTPSNTGSIFTLSLTCIGNAPSVGTGLLDGVITLRSDTNMTWNGVATAFFNPQNLVATRAPNDGANDAPIQRWIVKGAVFDFAEGGIIQILNATGETNLTGSFEGVVSYEGNTTITLSPDAPHEPSDLLFTDLQPIATGGIERLCGVQGLDATPSDSTVGFFLSLTCDGATPTSGTASLDGIITLRSDTNFTWDGVARTSLSENPLNLTATRAPNDGANDATEQRWIVKGQVFDFTRVGRIVIINAIGETNMTGSFEGELYRDSGQPIAYTATINIKADELTIPTASQTAEGRPTASIGQIVIGKEIVLGTTDANAISKSLLDFSTIERLPEGDFDVFKRHATYEINVRTQYPAKDGQKVQRIIHSLTPAKPAFFYVPDFVSDDESEGKPLGAGMYLYGIIELASFGVDSENEPSADAGELVELKIGGLV